MPKNDLNVTLKGIDELLFSTEEQRQLLDAWQKKQQRKNER